jgi:7-cyano-7-deazaguanine reductase
MSTDHGVLGRATDYQFAYNPRLLYPISRKSGRGLLGIDDVELPFYGIDRWTAYELSWLNPQGLPQVAIGEFDFPCESPSIIESKSFKLYLNSFNQSVFRDIETVQQTMVADLSEACGSQVAAKLFCLHDYACNPASGYFCIDGLDTVCEHYLPEPALLKTGSEVVRQKLCSHLFRSLCPVTGQPDWASVFVEYLGASIVPESLLQYLVSYRNHQGFHEQCVEQIVMDMREYCHPQELTVFARFLRRGGLDINPLRSSALPVLSDNIREVRQ